MDVESSGKARLLCALLDPIIAEGQKVRAAAAATARGGTVSGELSLHTSLVCHVRMLGFAVSGLSHHPVTAYAPSRPLRAMG